MTIIIADDDKNIRFFLKSLLLELRNNITIYEASNGLELVNLVSDINPDLAFVDISMPLLNGLDAITESKKINSTTEFVVLTGYSEFEYAKKGIQLNVLDYILKPIKKEELELLLDRFEKKLTQSILYTNSLLKSSVLAAINFNILQDKLKAKYNYYVIAFHFIIKKEDTAILNNTVRKLSSDINAFFRDMDFEYNSFCTLFTREGNFILVIDSKEELFLKFKTFYQTLFFETCKHVASYLTIEDLTSIDTTIQTLTKSPLYALDKKASSIEPHAEETNDFSFIYDIITSNNPDETTLLKLEDANINNLKIFESLSVIYDIVIKDLNDFKNAITKEFINIENAEIEVQALSYIEKNYSSNIGVREIAYELNITPNYLSSVFKKKMGVKLSEYLTSYRMTKAHNLIKSTNLPIKNIAIMVGIGNTRYFSTLFKQIYGCLPRDVKK